MKYAYTSAMVTLAASATVHAQEVTFDLASVGSWDSPGSPNNIVLTASLPAGSIVSSVSWTDVVGSGLGGPSWGNEMQMDVNGEVNVQFFPAEGSGSAGGTWGPASGSSPANFSTDELVLEFYESYDDAGDTVDAEYVSGTITITYGSAEDCNGNGVDDSEELDATTDCDSSGVLDECESLTDCDANGVPDVCEGAGVANDTIAGALPLGLNDSVSGSTTCAGEEATYGDQCDTEAFTGDGPDVFYSLSLTEVGTIDLWSCNSDYDTDLSIHALDGSVIVCDGDSGDDEAGDGCLQFSSRITTLLQAGDYIVRVGGWQGTTGNYVVDSSFVAGDPCAGGPQIFNVVSAADFIAQIGPGLADLCPGDIINWGPGVYDWGYTISLAANGVIHRGSVDGNGDPTTIITGDNQRQCLTFFGVEIYENMIFEDGVSGGDGGAFILNPSFGKVTFRNCVFRNNTSGSLGGAVCNLGAQNGSEFIDCLFVGNSGNDAGACIALNNGADGAIFTNCEFRGNTANNTGGAICTAGGSPTINGCLFQGNNAFAGGGIYINGGDTATVSNSTICGNNPDQYAGSGTFDDQGGNTIATSCNANDCNGNNIPDGDELEGNDCNENGTLDECELFGADCDDNGTLDECELADGTGEDSNQDGVLDACQPCLVDACADSDFVYPADQGATNGGTVACSTGGTITVANTYLNVYSADDIAAGGLSLSCASIPMVNSGSDLEATVTVVSIPEGPISIATMTPLADKTLCVVEGVVEFSFDEPVAIEPGSRFGIVLDTPDSPDGFASIGVMTEDDASETFILSVGCGINDFTPYTGIGFADPAWTIQMSFVADDEPCVGDVDGDGGVGFSDLLVILNDWGAAGGPGDLDGDGNVGFSDVLVILNGWGAC